MIRRRLLLVLAAVCATLVGTTKAAEIPAKHDVLDVMRRVADWQLANLGPKQKQDWIRSTFYTGVMATYRATGDAKYLDEATKWGDAASWDEYRGKKRADDLACAQVYAEIAMAKGNDAKYVEKVRKSFDQMIAEQVRGRVEWWWCDTLFMAPPGMARLSKLTGDPKYLDAMNAMWWDCTDFLYDKDERLYFRDKSFFHQKTKNGKEVFWSRGNGWVAAGTVRVLEYLPDHHPGREKYVKLHRDMLDRIAGLQGDDGLWGMSLLDRVEWPMGESSGSAFFAYAIAWGINHGTLDREKYLPVLLKTWEALNKRVLDDGKFVGVQGVAGGPTTSLNTTSTAEYASGAFLLLCEQMAQMKR